MLGDQSRYWMRRGWNLSYPEAGLLVHSCYWPQQQNVDDILSVSDVEMEAAENPPSTTFTRDNRCHISVTSSAPDPKAGTDSPMGEGDDDATVHEEDFFLHERGRHVGGVPRSS